jgi:hypothetical protein
MHYVHIIFKEKNQAENIGTRQSHSHTHSNNRDGLWCASVGGITWSSLKSDLTYFRLPAPDGSAMPAGAHIFRLLTRIVLSLVYRWRLEHSPA